MNAQPLLFDNMSAIFGNNCLPLQIGQFQSGGLACQFPRRSRLCQYDFITQCQSLPGTQTLMEFKCPQEAFLLNELKQEFSEFLSKLTPVMKAKDGELYRHSLRVQTLALPLAAALQLPEEEVLTIGLAAFFHDIGKLGIDEAILYKVSSLTDKEFEILKKHPIYGAEMLSQFKMLKNVAPLVYHHHERWDGGGYPDGIGGDAIPLGARIVAIVDAFEAMTSYRIYQHRRTPLEALEELCRCAGTQFDARLVILFCSCLETTLGTSIDVIQVGQADLKGH